MSYGFSLNPAHRDQVERTLAFARDSIRPVADRHDREEEFLWEVLEAAAEEGFYNPLCYRDLIGDPTGLSLLAALCVTEPEGGSDVRARARAATGRVSTATRSGSATAGSRTCT